MKNIVLARIDERLIHGQVATQWLNLIAANTIVVADDKIPSDNFMTMILKAVCPRNCELHLLTAEEAAEFLKGEPGTERVFVVTKGPEAMLKMIEGDHPRQYGQCARPYEFQPQCLRKSCRGAVFPRYRQ